MVLSKYKFLLMLYVMFAYAPVLVGYLFLAWGYTLVILTTIVEPEMGENPFIFLLYLAGLVILPLIFISSTFLIWKNTPNPILHGASLYVGLFSLTGLLLFLIMAGIGGISMAAVDNPGLDLTTPAIWEAVKWLFFGQVIIIPWSIGATTLFQWKFSKYGLPFPPS